LKLDSSVFSYLFQRPFKNYLKSKELIEGVDTSFISFKHAASLCLFHPKERGKIVANFSNEIHVCVVFLKPT